MVQHVLETLMSPSLYNKQEGSSNFVSFLANLSTPLKLLPYLTLASFHMHAPAAR